MAEPVKKPYHSALRTAQAHATRQAIVNAAARLFIQYGYGATTVDAIAEAAGVSRKTVFTSVGGKVEALKLALDWAIVGDDEPVPMLERPHIKALQQEPDARRILARYAAHVRQTSARTAPLHEVVRAAAGLDAEIRALAEEMRAQRIRGMQVLAQHLAARGALQPGLTPAEAADVLWLLNDPGVYHRLVTEQGWPPGRYQDWLAGALISLLIAPDYRPPEGP
ncbi:MAG: TetR/AcrR family transcriptional regulator [Streptosporangiaceae bacterium]|nr:TetR/AcrR family transcriptional regulator [Streptosporangiaceae bacterium]MBV9856842.1 TetR/AcrR family transcriptional regulator [Streptosporangiaceae bacterium]